MQLLWLAFLNYHHCGPHHHPQMHRMQKSLMVTHHYICCQLEYN
jgi:hypothetical protein